jgi:prophage regulatory protein
MRQHSSDTDDLRLLRLPEVLRIVPVGRATWWAKVRTGEYPQPIRLGPRTVAWRLTDIRKLIETGTTNDEA